MGRYIRWNNVVGRYSSLSDIGGADDVSSNYIQYAEVEIDGRLAPKFTTPFSSNNLTVKDLCIDLVYAKAGNLNIEDYDKLMDRIDKRIERLLAGEENMMTNSGDTLQQSIGGTVWSSTQNYTPTFGHGAVEDFVVDPDLIDDEENARS